MPVDKLNLEKFYRAYLIFCLSRSKGETFKSTLFFWWINWRVCWNILLRYFFIWKKSNKTLKLHISKVIQQTFLTVQSQWKAIYSELSWQTSSWIKHTWLFVKKNIPFVGFTYVTQVIATACLGKNLQIFIYFFFYKYQPNVV